ncbi:sugar-binding protein [Candidatus Leptofilum sp.]|uniref:sugar-binding protein n=1 Tax=Candidatus Leptofilum sp. TaxID=3241576 RepID=UPI003B5C6281
MHDPQRNLDDDWAGLEPESRDGFQTMLYAGIGIALLFGVIVCGAAAYFFWSQFQDRTTAEDAPAIALPTAVEDDAPTEVPTDSPEIAPTNTLPVTAVATSIPLGSGAIEASFTAAPPTIDGNLSDWPGATAASSTNRVYSVAGWDGSEDLTAVWQLAWDNGNLYVAVRVTDDTHVQTASGNQIFRGDSVDMQFDTARDADFGDGLSPDDFQITLSPGDFAGSGPTAFRYRGTTGGAILDAPGGNIVTVAAQQTADGYTLEAAIPWTDLNVEPSDGLTIGLALNANDNDTPGTAVQEVMMSHMPNRTLTNPTTWGTLTLK